MMIMPSHPLSHDEVEVVRAKPEGIDTVLGILDEAAAWIIKQNLPTVWKPGGFSREAFLEQISRGEVHLGLVSETPAATITLQWSDLVFWGEQQPNAGYFHKLAVRPLRRKETWR